MSSRGQPKIFSACEFQFRTLPCIIDLDEGVECGLDDVACELLAFVQRFLRQPAFGHVAADEEVTLHRFGPVAIQDSVTTRPSLWM